MSPTGDALIRCPWCQRHRRAYGAAGRETIALHSVEQGRRSCPGSHMPWHEVVRRAEAMGPMVR